MNLYCTDCGTKHEFTLNKPKFCSNCGSAFDKTAVAKTKAVKKDVDDEIPDSGEDADIEVPKILKIEGSVSATPTIIKFEDLAKIKQKIERGEKSDAESAGLSKAKEEYRDLFKS